MKARLFVLVVLTALAAAVQAQAYPTKVVRFIVGYPAGGSIDVVRFHQHTRRGRQLLTLGHPGQAAEAFRQALAQWRGPALADLRDFNFASDASRALGGGSGWGRLPGCWLLFAICYLLFVICYLLIDSQ